MDKQVELISKAYDLAVEQYEKQIDPFSQVPDEFKNSPEFKAFISSCRNLNMGNLEIRTYLAPEQGMRFLDAGCGGGLASYKLYLWPSTYYGVDISPRIIEVMKAFSGRMGITIGGLFQADLSCMPFEDTFFDIAAMIGVLEYYGPAYIHTVLKELYRVLRPGARVVMDIPNQEHPGYPIMVKLEEYLKRPHTPFGRSEFERILREFFSVQRIDDSEVMITYFTNKTDS